MCPHALFLQAQSHIVSLLHFVTICNVSSFTIHAETAKLYKKVWLSKFLGQKSCEIKDAYGCNDADENKF